MISAERRHAASRRTLGFWGLRGQAGLDLFVNTPPLPPSPVAPPPPVPGFLVSAWQTAPQARLAGAPKYRTKKKGAAAASSAEEGGGSLLHPAVAREGEGSSRKRRGKETRKAAAAAAEEKEKDQGQAVPGGARELGRRLKHGGAKLKGCANVQVVRVLEGNASSWEGVTRISSPACGV